MKEKAVIMTLLVAAIGCTKTEDVAPEISLTSPTHEQVFQQGETISFKATFTDNEELSEYRVDIHEAGGHSHKPFINSGTQVEWDYEKTGTLSGKSETVELSISIDAAAEVGAYDVLVECTDKEGNEAEHVLIEIDIQ